MQIQQNLKKYEFQNKELIKKIQDVIKSKEGKWDLGITEEDNRLTEMLLYEYSTAIENLTKGKLKTEFVINKLASKMGTLRYGDFKPEDSHIEYGRDSVTSEDYKRKCRIDGNFGAHQIDYDEDGKNMCSVVLFDNSQKYIDSNGNEHILSGIDLSDLTDIRHTIFHEWTHIMEKCIVKASTLKREDIIKKVGDSTYINACVSPDLSKSEYDKFIENVDNIIAENGDVMFAGISTIEINGRKAPKGRIMHNQISEGLTEYISRLVMKETGDKEKDSSRYSAQVDIVKKIFESKGINEALTIAFTSPQELTLDLEERTFEGQDLLHYMSRHIDFLAGAEKFIKDKIKTDNVNLEGQTKETYSRKKTTEFQKSIMNFWKENQNPTQEEVQNFILPLMQNLTFSGLEDEKNAQNFLSRLAVYPKIERNFQNMLKNEFPLQSEKEESTNFQETQVKMQQLVENALENNGIGNRNTEQASKIEKEIEKFKDDNSQIIDE